MFDALSLCNVNSIDVSIQNCFQYLVNPKRDTPKLAHLGSFIHTRAFNIDDHLIKVSVWRHKPENEIIK